jgi:hypothetical protein
MLLAELDDRKNLTNICPFFSSCFGHVVDDDSGTTDDDDDETKRNEPYLDTPLKYTGE